MAASVSTAPEINLRAISKSYDGIEVLHPLDLTIAPGEIHGLLGENGAGKSTLLKILGGAVPASGGTITIDGAPVALGTPRAAIAHGVSLISQELSLVPRRSVVENVFLGRWAQRGGFARQSADAAALAELCERTGFALRPDAVVADLSVGEAQQVEILKALARGSRVLCLDEPTAALGEHDTEKLLTVLRELSADGVTIVLVSHFLDEVRQLADRITVLRDGHLITTADAAEHDTAGLVRLMVGRDVAALTAPPEPIAADAALVLDAVGLRTDRLHGVDLQVRRGEVVGLAGLVGSGRTETLRALFGADRLIAGSVRVHDKSLPRKSVRAAIAAGMALVPESRKDDGLVLGRSAAENIALPTLARRQWGGVIRRRAEHHAVQLVAERTDIRGAVEGSGVGALSGGNQQKALFAKWLVDPPRVLLIDEPTRGVDIAAKVTLHHLIHELAAAGTAVVVASSDLEEVIGLSHRIAVMRSGRIVAEFPANSDRAEIMSAAFSEESVR